ncbi:MAG: hypothetical protein HPY55_03085 [Firmicutes bacterium]|nr:hypothetical protein [Bacillota bacterium]
MSRTEALATDRPAWAMSAITAGLTPIKNVFSHGTDLYLRRSTASTVTTSADGATTPRVAAAEPATAARRNPTNVAVLTAIGPGVISAMATMSTNCSSVSQPCVSIPRRRLRRLDAPRG